MDSLRDLLKTVNPDLHRAFTEIVKYVENYILPAMPTGRDDESLNSLPHLKDNEKYLNGILPISEKFFDSNESLFLSQYELYCMLSSIVLHDIGRVRCGAGHGTVSKEMILELIDKLQIPSPQLADAIGNICEIHEPEELKKENHPNIDIKIFTKKIKITRHIDKKSKNEKINEIPFERYYPVQMLDNNNGFVRVNELGALLSLVDNMDATYRRLKPLDIMGKDNYVSAIALIRNFIKSVTYSRESQAVIVAINEYYYNREGSDKFTYKLDWDKAEINKMIDNLTDKIKNKRKEYADNREKIEKKFIYVPVKNDNSLYDLEWILINGTYIKNIESGINHTLLKKIIECLKTIDCNKNQEDKKKLIREIQTAYPFEVLIPMVLGNIKACHRSLIGKYKYLSRLGIPVKTWLIYHNEHLYNYHGEETYEPVFSKDYLEHIAKTMWELSTRVFGKSFFSYEMLASAAHEVNLKLVKLAVKRLEIISRHEYIKPDNDNQPQKSTNLEFEDKFSSSINYNANGWQWEYSENANNRKCNFYSYNKLKDRIDNLSEPIIKP